MTTYGFSRTPPLIEIGDLVSGDILTDFRGKKWQFVHVEPDGYRIRVRQLPHLEAERTFFAGVLGVRDPRLEATA